MILLTIFLLAVMEVSLSFDNAVVNASVLTAMPPIWQKRFLSWGLPIAVFGMRLLLPVAIVSIASKIDVVSVLGLAINKPEEYARHLTQSHNPISSFGGIFLLMVFLKFLFDETKNIHWLHALESRLSLMGKIEAIEILICIIILIFLPHESLVPGLLGLSCYVIIDGVMGMCGDGENPSACISNKRGLMRLIYLEVLDASFSLDGVLGAFAISNNIISIMIGLGIGAAVIRTLTIRLVQGKTLQQFIYLEHGAHYGIGSLAILMLISTKFEISEIITGLIGVFFIILSMISSLNNKENSQ